MLDCYATMPSHQELIRTFPKLCADVFIDELNEKFGLFEFESIKFDKTL